MPTAIYNAPNGPYAAGTTPIVTGQIVDAFGNGLPGASLDSLTLTIVDTASGQVINGASQVNILNTGRGTVDASGNFVISLLPGDTAMDDVPGVPQVQRSLVLDWASGGNVVGRFQVNFQLVALAGA